MAKFTTVPLGAFLLAYRPLHQPALGDWNTVVGRLRSIIVNNTGYNEASSVNFPVTAGMVSGLFNIYNRQYTPHILLTGDFIAELVEKAASKEENMESINTVSPIRVARAAANVALNVLSDLYGEEREDVLILTKFALESTEAEKPAPTPVTNVKTAGRTELDALFFKSGILEKESLPHNPYLVFVRSGDTVTVQIVESTKVLVQNYSDSTPVMVQWPGKYRSDFFRFTVGDVRQYIIDHNVRLQ